MEEAIKKILVSLQLDELLNYSIWDYSINVILTALFAIPLFVVFYVVYKDKFKNRRIQFNRRTPLRVKREIRNSVISLFVFTCVDTVIYLAQLKGYTKIYTDVNQYGWLYLAFSVVFIILFHDTYLYFIHRAMHLPFLYNRVHKVHHESIDPSPFAAFSFHPFEAVMEASVYVCLAFLLPVHLIALTVWQVVQISMAVIAHMGYEIYPKNFNKHWLFKYKTPATHHNMHHAKFNGNYGLYFTWWDKFFGTEFKDYHQTFDAVHERISKGETAKQPEVEYAAE